MGFVYFANYSGRQKALVTYLNFKELFCVLKMIVHPGTPSLIILFWTGEEWNI